MSIISDPLLAKKHLLESDYYLALDIEEKNIKYPTLSLDQCFLEVTNIKPYKQRLSRFIPMDINIIMVNPQYDIEMGASWTCASTIFLQDPYNLEHEYCHTVRAPSALLFNIFIKVKLNYGDSGAV